VTQRKIYDAETLILNSDGRETSADDGSHHECAGAGLYRTARQEAVCRPRIDIQIPTKDSNKID
jgi:hypothetical protein